MTRLHFTSKTVIFGFSSMNSSIDGAGAVLVRSVWESPISEKMNLDLGVTWIRDSLKYLVQLHLPLCLTTNLGPHVGRQEKAKKTQTLSSSSWRVHKRRSRPRPVAPAGVSSAGHGHGWLRSKRGWCHQRARIVVATMLPRRNGEAGDGAATVHRPWHG